jgi:hypothetical protein
MATYQKFEVFVEHLASKVHDLLGTAPGTADVLKVYLSDTAISLSGDNIKSELAEITPQNGYPSGGIAITNIGSRTGGTFTLTGLSVQVAASGGVVGPFTHVVLYNDTPTSPADPLIAAWSRGSALQLDAGETFDIKFNNAAVGVQGTIFTLA